MFKINFKKLNPLPGAGRRDIVSVDLSSSKLRLARVKVSPNRREISSLLYRDITGLNDADIAKILRECFLQSEAKNTNIIDVIPSSLVITKNIEIPSTDPQEIKEIINLQAARHTPYSAEEIIVDYIDTGIYKHNYSKVLLVIVARNVIKRQFDILTKAGLILDRVVLAPESFGWHVPRMLKIENQDAPVNIVHIDDGFTDFTIVIKGKVVFVRSIPIGKYHLVAESTGIIKEKYQVRFMEELKRSLEAYQTEDIEKNPNLLILTGAIEDLDDLLAILNNNFYLPVKTVPCFRNLAISNQALASASAAKTLSFLGVVAPLLCIDQMKVNLLPEEIKLRKSLESRGRDLIKTGILVLGIFVLLFLILISKFYFKSMQLNKLNTEYAALTMEAQKLEKDFSRVNLIKGYLANRGYPLEVLTELYNLTPLELELSDIRFDQQGAKCSLRGTAESMSVVFSFVDTLERSRYFRDVKTKYTSKRKAGTKDLTDFEINATFEVKKD